MSFGFLGTFLLNNFLREVYTSRKSNIENSIESFLNKKVELGDYSGIRFLGIGLENSKIIDKNIINSEIKTNNLYVGIMPFRSFLKQKWLIKIRPDQTQINIHKDFFKRDEPFIKELVTNKSKFNYELNLNLNKYSNLELINSGLKTKVKGNLIYKPSNDEIIAYLKSNFNGQGILKFKFNTKLNNEFLRL